MSPTKAPDGARLVWRPASFAFFRDESHALELALDMAARGYRVSICGERFDRPVVLGEQLEARPRGGDAAPPPCIESPLLGVRSMVIDVESGSWPEAELAAHEVVMFGLVWAPRFVVVSASGRSVWDLRALREVGGPLPTTDLVGACS